MLIGHNSHDSRRAQNATKPGPPAFVAAIVEARTPRRFRRGLPGHLLSNYTSRAFGDCNCRGSSRTRARMASIVVEPLPCAKQSNDYEQYDESNETVQGAVEKSVDVEQQHIQSFLYRLM